jgi:hypothetical protein
MNDTPRRLRVVAARLRSHDGVNCWVATGRTEVVAGMLDAEAAAPEPTVHREACEAIADRVLTSEPWLLEDAA